ncbi:MAG: YaiI/YqxD family protein [Candidatus Latescibacterota bacterium]|nr:MAG: YaiI/YqxD family protein [Candidatus Latescibacterota bacterium]
MLEIFVDADGCPVKEEVYRVAKRYALQVTLVANSWMRIPDDKSVQLVVVEGHQDAADDWIVEHVGEKDLVITGDIPLASRCLKQGALVLGLKGRPFTEDNIGGAVATRDLLSQLREAGGRTRGPSAFEKRDRSRFLQSLDEMIQRLRREA